jgi:hypothetical protein
LMLNKAWNPFSNTKWHVICYTYLVIINILSFKWWIDVDDELLFWFQYTLGI